MDRTLLFGLLAMIPTIFAYERIIRLVTDPMSPVAPNLASWSVWTTVDGSILVSSIAAGAWMTMGVFGVYTFGCLTVILLVLRRGTMRWTRFDLGCLAISATAFVAWMVSGDPVIAIYLNVAVAVVGSLPTVRQSWYTPEKEDLRVWQLLTAGGVLNLGAIGTWNMVNSLAPLSVLSLQLLIVGALVWSPRKSVTVSMTY